MTRDDYFKVLANFPKTAQVFYYPFYEEGFYVHGREDAPKVDYDELVSRFQRSISYSSQSRARVLDLYFSPSRRDQHFESIRIRTLPRELGEDSKPDETVRAIVSFKPESEQIKNFGTRIVVEFLPQNSKETLERHVVQYVAKAFDLQPLFQLEKIRHKFIFSPPVIDKHVAGGDFIDARLDQVMRISTVTSPEENLCAFGVLPSCCILEFENGVGLDHQAYLEVRKSVLDYLETEATLTPKRKRKYPVIADYLSSS